MSAVFADTFFFLALLNDQEPSHEKALAESTVNRRIVTTEFILLELGNACARAEDHADFLVLLEGVRASSRITIVPLNSMLMNRGLELMANRPDKDLICPRTFRLDCDSRLHLFANVCQLFFSNLPRTCGECRRTCKEK